MFYALVPAAGFGARMGQALPKQYLPLAGKPMIGYALHTLCQHPQLQAVFVVLSPGDTLFAEFDWSSLPKLKPLYCGGETRADSVLNGLRASGLAEDDWVLVHDAARPCLSAQQIDDLLLQLADDEVGGILAVPVADTLKRAGAGQRIRNTENREGLWQAQTPQMFRAGLLTEALTLCPLVTDEASAIEFMGKQPKLVLGSPTNFKVTYPQDIRLAELLLTQDETQK